MSDFLVHSTYKTLQLAQATGSTNTEYAVGTAYSAAGEVQTASAATLVYASEMKIKSDQTITVRLNSTSNDAISVASADGYITIENFAINKIFISNASGNTANIKVILLGKLKVSL